MPQHLRLAQRILSILMVCGIFLVFAPPLAAQESNGEPAAKEWYNPTQEPRVELFLSSVFANSASEGSFGVRGAIPLQHGFHFEGSVSRLNDSRVDLWMIDLSAKYYLRDGDRTDLYLVAGPGIFYSSDLDANETTVHLGFGAEIAIGQRFYIRPELRSRWFTERFGDSHLGDLSVGFGWRL